MAACNLIAPNEEGNHRSARACENGPDKLHVSMIETVVPVGDLPQAP